jgi:TPP-dependent pyruvate/acetoin dehydrogenase alpha subunit
MNWLFPKRRAGTPEERTQPVEGIEANFLHLYRAMFLARCIDELEAKLVARGEAFFHVSGAGHEGSAVLNAFLRPDDYLHLHYRDKALMLARGIQATEKGCNDLSEIPYVTNEGLRGKPPPGQATTN